MSARGVSSAAMPPDTNGWLEYKRYVVDKLEAHGRSIDRNRLSIDKLDGRIDKMELRLAAGAAVFGVVIWIISNWGTVLRIFLDASRDLGG